MTEFITRSCKAESSYEVIIKTDSEEHYHAAQNFARRLIGHEKPKTNADRIRAMSDEELAEFLQEAKFYCQRNCEKCLRGTACISMLQWLQQPAEGE